MNFFTDVNEIVQAIASIRAILSGMHSKAPNPKVERRQMRR